MGMEGNMGPPGSQNNMGPSNSEGSMYSPSRYPSQQRSAPVCVVECHRLHFCKVKAIAKFHINLQIILPASDVFLLLLLLPPLLCFRHDGYSQQYPSMPYGMHPSGMYPQQQVRVRESSFVRCKQWLYTVHCDFMS